MNIDQIIYCKGIDQKLFSIVTIGCLSIIQLIVLIFWFLKEDTIIQQDGWIYEKVQKIVGCLILTISYVLLLGSHFISVKKNQILQIAIFFGLSVGQIVMISASNKYFWPFTWQPRQLMEIISIIIFFISMTNIQLLRSSFQVKISDIQTISFRQQQQLIVFASFALQLLITLYFISTGDEYNYGAHSDEINDGTDEFNDGTDEFNDGTDEFNDGTDEFNYGAFYPIVPNAALAGSIIITMCYFLQIILNYFKGKICSLIYLFIKVVIIVGIILEFVGHSKFQQKQEEYYTKIDQNVLLELVLISLFLSLIALFTQTTELSRKDLLNQEQSNQSKNSQLAC